MQDHIDNIMLTEGKTRGNVKEIIDGPRPIRPPKGPKRQMKFLINTHFIDGGYGAMVDICRECSSTYQMSPVKTWMFEVDVPENKVERFRLFVNCFKTSEGVDKSYA